MKYQVNDLIQKTIKHSKIVKIYTKETKFHSLLKLKVLKVGRHGFSWTREKMNIIFWKVHNEKAEQYSNYLSF